jgi:hypothetical protein
LDADATSAFASSACKVRFSETSAAQPEFAKSIQNETKPRHPQQNLPDHPSQIANLESGLIFQDESHGKPSRGFRLCKSLSKTLRRNLGNTIAPGMEQIWAAKPNRMTFLALTPLFGQI